jgi:poly(3-hydroxybutyrate) depolymerase
MPRRAMVLLAGWSMVIAACTGSHPVGQHAPGLRGPATGAPLASPGLLVDRPVASSGCGRGPAVLRGTTARLTVAVPPASSAGVRERSYWLHVPAHYAAGRLTPLVLAFHGGGGTGIGMQLATGLSTLADQRGFLVAYPQALAQDHGRGPFGWDASGPRDPFADGIDDALFVSDMLNAVQAGYCVDPARIAATGISNGGSMTGYLACVLAGRVAAFAPVEAVFFQIPGGCRPVRPAAILDVHVVTDPVAPFAGVPSRGSPDYYALAIPAWLRAWALRDGCSGGSRIILRSPEVTSEQWDSCPAGVSVAGYRLASGGHSWFRAIGAAAGDQVVLGFFAGHPLRALKSPWSAHPDAVIPALAAPRIAVRSLRQFHLPTPGAEPFDIAAGPDGSMWFTEFHADKIGRISPAGVITEFRVPTADAGPYQITAGPGGSMWFTEYNTTKIGRVSPGGLITEISLPPPTYGGAGITGSPAGPVWVADPAGYLDRINSAGIITRTKVPDAGGIPFAITRSSRADLWFSELTGYFEYSRVLRSLDGGPGRPPSELTLANRRSNIDALAAGPAGTVWFTDFGTSQIGDLSPGGQLRLFSDPAPDSGLSDIALGPDGAMWFAEQAGIIGRITAGGAISELALPSAGTNPDGVAAGPGRTVWITETEGDAVTRAILP